MLSFVSCVEKVITFMVNAGGKGVVLGGVKMVCVKVELTLIWGLVTTVLIK